MCCFERKKSEQYVENVRYAYYRFFTIFANVGLQVAFLVPTPTGYQKSIMDATIPLREMLREMGIHNYVEQKQGPEFKELVKTYF